MPRVSLTVLAALPAMSDACSVTGLPELPEPEVASVAFWPTPFSPSVVMVSM